MKRVVLILLNLLLITEIFAQKVELLISTNEVYETPRLSEEQYCESWWGPSGMYVDEVEDEVSIITRRLNKSFSVQNGKISKTETLNNWYDLAFIKLGDVRIGCEGLTLFVGKNDFSTYVETGSGVCFILKNEIGYIIYYVDNNGIPGAVDTEGKIYTNKEAIAYLKKYDSEKYAESLARAEELGLKELFLNAEVLVWGKTYYSTLYLMTEYWKGNKDAYLFVKISDKIQYDL